MKSYKFTEKQVPCAIFMSGSGSNAEALIEFERRAEAPAYHVKVLVTDAPESSRTREIAGKYGLPVVEHDIKEFYRQHGEETTKLDTPRRCELRELWSDELYRKVAPFSPAFGCFAGFVPLSNIASCIPCLNVHPGDLTREDSEGRRLYAGLHVLPVEKAILNGDEWLRSSVILVQPYTGSGAKEMDGGPVLGVSKTLAVDKGSYCLEELAAFKAKRIPGQKCCDPLREMALEHIEKLKVAGDHVVFPRAASDFASGLFSVEDDRLFYRGERVLSVEYSVDLPPRALAVN